MSMWIGVLILREAASHLRSPRFRVATALVIGLAMLTVAIGLADVRDRRVDSQLRANAIATARLERKSVLSSLGTDIQLRAVRLPPIGSVLVKGVDGTLPSYWDFNAFATTEGPPPPSLGQGAGGVGALFDLEAIVRVILGLLAITVGLDSIASERTTGTLSSLLAQPVSRTGLAAGKLIGSVVAFGACIGVMCLSVISLLWLEASDFSPLDLTLPLLSMAGLSLAYLAIMTAIGMAIGSVVRSVGTATALGIGVWVTFTLVAPWLAAFGPHAVRNPPSRQAEESALQRMYNTTMNEHVLLDLGRVYLGAESAPNLKVANALSELPAARQRMSDAWRPAIAMVRRNLEQEESRWRNAVALRIRWTHWLSWISPATTYLLTASAMAGTGESMRSDWQTDIHEYQAHLNQGLFDFPARVTKLIVVAGDGTHQASQTLRSNITIDEVGTFVPPEDSLGRRLRGARWDLFILGMYLVGFSVLAVTVFPKAGF